MGERHLDPQRVRYLREAAGLRRSDLARAADINAGYLTRIEDGDRSPSVAVMAKLAHGLGCAMEDITYVTHDTANTTDKAVSA